MKKLLYSVAIITVLFSGSFFASAQSTTQVTADVNQTLGSGLTPCTDAKSADCYQLLEPLPQKQEDGTYKYINNFNIGTEGKDDKGIAGFINFMFEIGIGIAGVLGVVMLTIYGFQYASNDKNINTFAELKTKITNVIFGILLLLGIFIILRTINPDLLIVEPDIAEVTIDLPEGADISNILDDTNTGVSSTIKNIYAPLKGHLRDGGTLRPATVQVRQQTVNAVSSSNLMDLRSAGVTVKSGAGTQVVRDVGVKIVAFNNSLKQKGINIIVTEAFKPTTYKHYAACQYTGTCIDADIPFNAQKLAILVNEAKKAGLVAVWETKSSSDYKAAIAAGVPQSNILLFKSHITGDHFSLYDYK